MTKKNAFQIICRFYNLFLFFFTVLFTISTITFTWWQMCFSTWVLWSIPSYTIWSHPITAKSFSPLWLTFATCTLKVKGLTRARGACSYHSIFIRPWSHPVTASRPFVPRWSWRLCTDVNSFLITICMCCCFLPSVPRENKGCVEKPCTNLRSFDFESRTIEYSTLHSFYSLLSSVFSKMCKYAVSSAYNMWATAEKARVSYFKHGACCHARYAMFPLGFFPKSITHNFYSIKYYRAWCNYVYSL